MSRPDLLALNSEALASLTNRGLLKRASTMSVQVAVDDDGTVRGIFDDGVVSSIAPGKTLQQAICSCVAPGICRHLLAVVLGYQQLATEAPAVDAGPAAPAAPAESVAAEPNTAISNTPEPAPWSPAEFDGAALTAHLGARVVSTAKRALAAGYIARVRRGSTPTVELPTCTVRFLVPHEIAYATSDATNPEMVALAVWACAAADAQFPADANGPHDVRVSVGGAAEISLGIPAAVTFAQKVLDTGVVHLSPQFSSAGVRNTLKGKQWPLDAVADLDRQLAGYQSRDAGYRSRETAALIAELAARHRSVVSGAGLPAAVLGTDESPQTPLRRVRLQGLGAHVRRSQSADDGRVQTTAEIYLAHLDSGTVLVLEHAWSTEASAPTPLGGHGTRRTAGATLDALASGNVITETAVRQANRTLRISAGRLGRTTVTPSGGDWDILPGNLIVDNFREYAAALAQLPPALVRPRVRAEFLRAVRVAVVDKLSYHTGEQSLTAEIRDADGNLASLQAVYNPASPGGLDSLAAALANGPTWIAGVVRRAQGRLSVAPTAVAVGQKVLVPDLVGHTGPGVLEPARNEDRDPLTESIDQALAALAEVAHRGTSQLPGSTLAAIEGAAESLHMLGLRSSADSLRHFLRQPAADSWLDAQIRLMIVAEQQ